MKSPAITIAKLTFKELIREKFFIIIFLIGLGMGGFSLLLGNLSLNEKNKIIFDISFSVAQLTTVFIGIFFGSYMIAKELEKQTLLLVLARPVSRAQFFLGKLLGLAGILLFFTMSLGIIPILLSERYDLFIQTLFVNLSLFFEAVILSLLAALLSNIVRPAISFIFSFSIMLLGHWLLDLQYFAQKSKDPFFVAIAKAIEFLTPQFYLFNWKSYFLIEQGISSQQFAWLIAHSSAWILIYFLIANKLFQRKDFV